MTHHQRVVNALEHREPDRVPIDLGGTRVTTMVVAAYEALKHHLGVRAETRFMDEASGRVQPADEILELLGVDTRMLRLEPAVGQGERVDLPADREDRWGVVWRFIADGRYYVKKPPLEGRSTLSDLATFRWPDPDDLDLVGLRARAAAMRSEDDRAIVLELPGRVFSLGQRLCGFKEWLTNLVANPRFCSVLLDRAVAIEVQMIESILEAVGNHIDVVLCADDLGMQSGPLISPDLYRQMIKPRQRRLFEAIKRNTNAKLMLHSDGGIAPLIGDFVDLGVDVLNPVQVSAAGMQDTRELKKRFGKLISFWGGVDTHRVLPFGTPQDVKHEVKRIINDLAPGGGYVLASVHNIQAEVPPANVCAMVEAARSFGQSGTELSTPGDSLDTVPR